MKKRKKNPGFIVFFIMIMLILCCTAYSRQLAFPGVEGLGRFASGGRLCIKASAYISIEQLKLKEFVYEEK